MQVYNFYSLFNVKNASTIEAKVIVRIGKIQLLPGAEVNPGVTIEGVDLFNIIGRNLQVKVLPGNVYSIQGVQNG